MHSYENFLARIPTEKQHGIEAALQTFLSDPEALSVLLSLIDDLNSEQLDIVLHSTESPMLILGGAGSGKTKVLTRRLAYLVLRGIEPENILAMTFTRKAAREIADRIEFLFLSLADGAAQPYQAWLREIAARIKGTWIMTIHAACLRILRETVAPSQLHEMSAQDHPAISNFELLGYGSHARLLDDDERDHILAELLAADHSALAPEDISQILSTAKAALIGPEQFKMSTKTRSDETAARVYGKYQQRLKSRSLLDLDDLVFKVHELLTLHPEVRAHYQCRFSVVLADEYQDSSSGQHLIGAILADRHRHIMAWGDDDQSIYSWRGADASNLARFVEYFPESEILKLTKNYRSDTPILASANHLWKDKPAATRKHLVRAKTSPDSSQSLRIVVARNENDEAMWIAGEIHRMIRAAGMSSPMAGMSSPMDVAGAAARTGAGQRGRDHPASGSEIAVLARSHHILHPIGEALSDLGIPWMAFARSATRRHGEAESAALALMEMMALSARKITAPRQWQQFDDEALEHSIEETLVKTFGLRDSPLGNGAMKNENLQRLVSDSGLRKSESRNVRPHGHSLAPDKAEALERISLFIRDGLIRADVWTVSGMLDYAIRFLEQVFAEPSAGQQRRLEQLTRRARHADSRSSSSGASARDAGGSRAPDSAPLGAEAILEFIEETRMDAAEPDDSAGDSTIEAGSGRVPPPGSRSLSVSLMTVHAAKGLEFDAVFLPAMEEGIFPIDKSLRGGGNKGAGPSREVSLEEEKRLFHVGLTRAKKFVVFTRALERKSFGVARPSKPSPFLKLLPKEWIDEIKL